MFVQNLEVGYYSGNTSFHEDLFWKYHFEFRPETFFYGENESHFNDSTCFLKKKLPFWVQ